MPLLDIAFLEDVSAGMITLACSIPALLFCAYVVFDDRREARKHSQGGSAHH
jgi:hypothetical protein